MSLDKGENPLGLKIIYFITSNIFWYLIFSLIYLNIDCREWWLIKSMWGRTVVIFFELTLYYGAFKKNDNGKD